MAVTVGIEEQLGLGSGGRPGLAVRQGRGVGFRDGATGLLTRPEDVHGPWLGSYLSGSHIAALESKV